MAVSRWLCLAVLGCSIMLGACLDASRFDHKTRPVPDFPDVRADLTFTCAYEKDAIHMISPTSRG